MQLESNLMNAYHEAYRMACEKLAKCNVDEVCQNSKAGYEKETNAYLIKYLGADYRVNCTSGEVALKNAEGEATITEKVLILHYLIYSKQESLSGRSISFMEVPEGGAIYYSTFKKRAVDPLIKVFSGNIPAFESAASNLSGTSERFGNVSYTINIFPMVPITYVIWQGDDEVASSGTILFDSSVTSFLPVEDIVLAASFGTYRLMAEAKYFARSNVK